MPAGVTIKLKRKAGAFTSGQLAAGEAGIDSTNGALYFSVDGSAVQKLGVPRVTAIVSNAAPTPNADLTDLYDITALAESATVGSPTGTPANGQKLQIRIKDNGVARALSWNAAYVAGGAALPTTTSAGKIMNLGFQYNTANSLNKWQLIARSDEA